MSVMEIPTDYEVAEQVVYLPLTDIRPAPDNPRGDNLGDLTGLVESIKSMGVLQAITVTPRPEDGQPPYMNVLGHRRHAAAILAGQDRIRAVIRDYDEVERIAAMHIENMNREDLKPTEEAASLRALKGLGMSERQIADRIGRTQGYVNKRLSLLGLPPEVQADLDAGRMTIGDALDLAKVKDEKKIRDILKASRRPTGDGKSYVYEGVSARAQHVVETAKRERAVKQVQNALRADGITVIDYPANHVWTGTARRLGTGYNEVDVDPDKHAKKPCHAAAVKPDAEIVYVCTDPAKHKPKAPKGDGSAVPARVADTGGTPEDIAAERARAEVEAWAEYHHRERERQRAELDAAAEGRHAFIADLLRGPQRKNDALILILTDYLAMCGGSARVLAWLGMDEGEPYDALTEYAGQSLANLIRAALAVRLDDTEDRMHRAGIAAFLDSDVRQHFDFLTAAGYEPTDIERRGLDQATEGDAEPIDADTDADTSEADGSEGEGDAAIEPATTDDAATEAEEATDADVTEAEATEAEATDDDATEAEEATDDVTEGEQAGEEGDPA